MAFVQPANEAASAFEDPERLYGLIAETIPVMVWTANAAGEVDFVNQRVVEYTGLDPAALTTWAWKTIVHPDDLERCVATWTRALQTGERCDNEMRLRRADGNYRWHHGSGVPMPDANGRPARWFGTCIDIEARIRSAEVLEQRFQAFMEHVPAMAWIRDPESRYSYVNKHYEQAFGVRAAEVTGKDPALFYPPQVAARFIESDRKVQRQGVPLQFIDSDPAPGRWLKVKFPLPDARGGVSVGGIAIDISAQMRLEEALHLSEQRFRAFMDHSPTMAWIKDSRLRYTYVNRCYEETFGRKLSEVIGCDVFAFHPKEIADKFRATDLQVQREQAPVQMITGTKRADGSEGRWLHVKFPLADATGAIGVGGIGVDITDRSRLEEALRESEQRFRAFMDNSPAIAWIKDASLRYTYINATHERIRGRSIETVRGRDDLELYGEEVARQFRQSDEATLRAGGATQTLEDVPHRDGRVGRCLIVKFPLTDREGNTGIAGMAVDISERVEAEERARKYAEDVRDLMNRLIATQESERRRISEDLHDLIGQNLTAAGIELSGLKAQLSPQSRASALPKIEAIGSLLNSTIEAIRGVMTELRPPALEEYGLAPALRWYASVFAARTGMKATVGVSGREARLRRETELALFRIAQEALTNAAKHSGGSAVHIALGESEGAIRLTIEDDGKGFADPIGARRARRGGWGLAAMRERAEAHGGALRIEFPARGTRVVVEIPRS